MQVEVKRKSKFRYQIQYDSVLPPVEFNDQLVTVTMKAVFDGVYGDWFWGVIPKQDKLPEGITRNQVKQYLKNRDRKEFEAEVSGIWDKLCLNPLTHQLILDIKVGYKVVLEVNI
jgi:hypothetical protein